MSKLTIKNAAEAFVAGGANERQQARLALVSLHLAEGVQMECRDLDSWQLEHLGKTLVFRLPSAASKVFARLKAGGMPMPEVADLENGNEGALFILEQLRRLWRAGLLTQSIQMQGVVAATLRAAGSAPLIPRIIDENEKLSLTSGSYVRKEGKSLLVESFECGASIELRSPQLFSVPTLLMEPATAHALIQQTNVPMDCIMPLLSWLTTLGAVWVGDADQQQDESLRGWSFADRLFHARSRFGRHIGGYGGTFHLRGVVPEAPAIRRHWSEQKLLLPKVDLDRLMASDAPFAAVYEKRISRRHYSSQPLTDVQLGEFLYRCARIRRSYRLENSEFTERPYPAAGGLYEIEIYPLISQCEGCPPALYWYDAEAHALERVSGLTPHAGELLQSASRSMGAKDSPQVLIILAARFRRIFWKYESVGYALIMKNVGVLIQSMYLAATAMGLAGCALGGGDSECFCRAAGTGFWEETSVGEFVVGRPPEEPSDVSQKK